jgi:hypothetical protein
MISVELSFERRARVWFSSPADWVTQPHATRRLTIAPRARVKDSRRIVVVELFVPAGGRFHYGLLGAETMNDAASPEGGILVELLVSASSGPVHETSLAGSLDTVRWGLPNEYADAVAASVEESVIAHVAPDVNRLRFTWAAHGHVGSSNAHFARLARIVMRLLTAPEEDPRAVVEAG